MSEVKVGDYLFRRIAELGVRSVFGVPGDYELALLDLIPENGLNWKGNPNELIASYAADGYGRMNGVGAFVSTFGPGELSAYCGVAGQYCEYVPAVHIVGYPGVGAQQAHAIMHHTLGDGKFEMYEQMSKHITVATTVLDDVSTAASEIDRVLNEMMYQSRPVYIGVPTDIAYKPISSSGLSTPLKTTLPPNDPATEKKVVTEIARRLETHKNPIIIVDGGATRFDVLPETNEIIRLTGLPTFTTAMGKGAVNETLSSYGGTYAGVSSHPEVQKAVESADAVLWVGNYPSDFNTGEFSERVQPEVIIDFERFWIKIGDEKFDVKMKYVLQALIKTLKAKPLARGQRNGVTWDPYPFNDIPKPKELTQDYLWPAFGRYFRKGDFCIAETGTAAYGIAESKLVEGVFLYNQTIFGSIGYATGAAVGAFLAVKEAGSYKRSILITGDGSLQLTVQAFADILRHDLKSTIFVLNNGGYTVERLIHGLDAPYNDVPTWNYSGLMKVFGPTVPSKYHLVKTADDLDKLFSDPTFNKNECTQLVELMLGATDGPRSVLAGGKAIEQFNKPKGVGKGEQTVVY